MQGTLKNKCEFSMAEICTKCYYPLNDKEGSLETIFQGIFVKTKFPKFINEKLYIRTNRNSKSTFARVSYDCIVEEIINKTLLPIKNIKVEVDSQEFGNYFDVYCKNKIIAMQLLTADVMQFLIDFKKEINIDYEITIKENQVFIRFMSGEMFEPEWLSKYSMDKATMYRYYKMLDFTFSLTNKLMDVLRDTEV